MESYKQESYGRRKRFNAGNIFGDPFALATISVAFIAWIIAFAASVVSAVQKTGYPNFSWWTLVFTLMTIVGITLAVASDTVPVYQVAIVGFLAAGLAFTTSSVNSLIYLTNGARAHDAASAGFILLSIVAIVWIFYFGSQPMAPHRQTIDSLALQKEGRMSTRTSRRMTHGNSFRPETTISQQPQMYTSAQLSGFETSSPVTGFPGGAIGASDSARDSQVRFGPPVSRGATETMAGSTVAPTDYPYRARAVYSYEANPEDANEISFAKHEILDVSDVSGRWWQARKANGETGIAPSNYLVLL